MTNENLPPLPCCVAHIELGDDSENVFTSDQMRDYARAALAMSPKPTSGTSERTAFERWYEGHCLPGEADWFGRDPDDPNEYYHGHTSEAWEGWQARAALAANEKVPNRATDIATALALPGCERLKEWAEIGPVQRAAVEEFAYALAAKAPEPVYQLSPTDIYDFAGWLTTRKESMQVGSSHEASQMAEAVGEYLKTYPERFAPDAAKVQAGYKLVPVEPTQGMLKAADDGDDAYTLRNFGPGAQRVMQGAEDHWAAMLAAAPAPEADTNEPLFTAEEVHAYCKRAREEERAEMKAAPAQAQQPLIDYEIVRIYECPELAGTLHESGTARAIAIARAIERAHGIGASGEASNA